MERGRNESALRSLQPLTDVAQNGVGKSNIEVWVEAKRR